MKITLLYGGQSAEHDISIISAHNIAQSIMYDVYTVQPIYITRAGEWIKGPLIDTSLPNSDLMRLVPAEEMTWGDDAKASTGQAMRPGELDREDNIVFPVLHGPNGEDGTIQGFLEVMGVPYVGAGVTASAIGMDKILSKRIFDQIGLPQVPYHAFDHRLWREDQEEIIQRIEGSLLYPLFVKPANMGSSVGISQVESSEALIQAIENALQYDHRIVVEQGISAVECEVAILGNEEAHISYVGKLIKDVAFYDYEEKYINNRIEMEIPAILDPAVASKIQEYALRAYRAIDGCGLSRVDFFVTSSQDIYINEINTMPGFTGLSMYPVLWEKTGLTQRNLVEELLQLALKKYEQKKGFKVE
ncbi:D-alanine--D-alanine ligase A [Suicoccus acidiformans]|uniref:D-alanine--D-alanine ligase n=1 Tax=Suicoccus acidiformans TaxID=2036206 RepID=A0A347WHU2_9LACT|nr:D-alanine--D-alanine ligase family protein [Suicoccus acidiformans]AXY24649.1 D-alanine--D-alanine ligase A [Suicoccus acidiformans]